MNEYILSIDSGTTGVTILIVDKNLKVVDKFYSEINQYYLIHWVEHDPKELIIIIKKLLYKAYNKYDFKSIKSIGITNQRETTVVWNKNSGDQFTMLLFGNVEELRTIAIHLAKLQKNYF